MQRHLLLRVRFLFWPNRAKNLRRWSCYTHPSSIKQAIPLVYHMYPVIGEERKVEDTVTINDCFSVNSKVDTGSHLYLLSIDNTIKTLTQKDRDVQ